MQLKRDVQMIESMKLGFLSSCKVVMYLIS